MEVKHLPSFVSQPNAFSSLIYENCRTSKTFSLLVLLITLIKLIVSKHECDRHRFFFPLPGLQHKPSVFHTLFLWSSFLLLNSHMPSQPPAEWTCINDKSQTILLFFKFYVSRNLISLDIFMKSNISTHWQLSIMIISML